MGVIWLIAGLWGFAEATLFFIVPDVVISWITLRRGLRAGFIGALCAGVGALAGGLVVYAVGITHGAALLGFFEHLPAISAGMIADARSDLAAQGGFAMITGGVRGTPFKIYAAIAGEQGLPLLYFVIFAIAARLLRFAAVVLVTGAVRPLLVRVCSERTLLILLGSFWVLFYALYFSLMEG